MKKKQSTLSWRGSLSKFKNSSSRSRRKQPPPPPPAAIARKTNSEEESQSSEQSDDNVTCSSKFSIVATYTPRNVAAAKLNTSIITVRSNDNVESSSAVVVVSQNDGQQTKEEVQGQADTDDMKVNGGSKSSTSNNNNYDNPTSRSSNFITDMNTSSYANTLELLRQTTIDNLNKLLTFPPAPVTTEPTTTTGTVEAHVRDGTDEEGEVVEVAADAATNSIITTEISKDDAKLQMMQPPQQTTAPVGMKTEDVPAISSKLSTTTTSTTTPVDKVAVAATRGGGGFLKEDVRDVFGRIKYGGSSKKGNKSSRAIAAAKGRSQSPKLVRRLSSSPSSLLSVTSVPPKRADSSYEMLDTKPDNGIEVDSSAPTTKPEAGVLSSLSSSSEKYSSQQQSSSLLTKKTKTSFEPFKPRKSETTCNTWLNNSSGPCSPMSVKDSLLERLCSPINEHDDDDTTTADTTSYESKSTKKMTNISTTTSLSKSLRNKFTNLCSPPSSSQHHQPSLSRSQQPSTINLLGQFDFDIGSRPWTPNHLSFDNNNTTPTSTIELSLPKSASKMKIKAATTQQTISDDTLKVVDDSEAEMITSTTQSNNNCWFDALTSPMDTFNTFLSCSGGSESYVKLKDQSMTIDNLNDFNSSKSRVLSWPLSKPEIHSNTAAVREKQAVELVSNAEGIIIRQADDIKEMQIEMYRQQSHQRNLTRQVAELQIELTNVKAKERELEELKAATAEEALHAKNALESQRMAHIDEMQKLGNKLQLKCQQAAKLESVISQIQNDIALHVAQKKIYDEQRQKESQTAIAIERAQEEKLMILKDGNTQEAIAQSACIRELEDQIANVQSRYTLLEESSKVAKAEADKKIRLQSIEVKKMKADWLERSDALAKLSQQVKDEAEEKMKTQAYELEKLKSDWIASSLLNTELSNEIDRLKRQRISELSNEIDRLKIQHGQSVTSRTTVNDISVSAAAAMSSKKSVGGNSARFSAKTAPFLNTTLQTVAPLNFASGMIKSSKGSKEEMSATVLSSGINNIGDDTVPPILQCQNSDPESNGSGPHISDSSTLSVSVFSPSTTNERKKGWLRKLVISTGLAVDCDDASAEEIPSVKAITGKKGGLWLRKKQQKGSSIVNNNLSVVEGESISSSDHSYTDNADDDVDILNDDNNNDTRYEEENANDDDDEASGNEIDDSDRESTDTSCNYSLNSLMAVHDEEPYNHEQDQIFDISNSSSGIVETPYYDEPQKKPVTNHWFSNVLNFGNADKQVEGRDEQEDQRRDVKSVRSRSKLPLVIL